MNIYEKLSNIQNELKAPKGQFNKFGGYKYRSCEDILEAVKPICKKYGTSLVLSDEIIALGQGISQHLKDEGNETETITRGQRFYIKAIATLFDFENVRENGAVDYVQNTAYAREEEIKKGMDGSQITGTASSYARKYALNGLFNIDDTKDADTDEFAKQTQDKEDAEKLSKEKINNTYEAALRKRIADNKIPNETVIKVLAKYGYSKLNEIELGNYKKICDELGGNK